MPRWLFCRLGRLCCLILPVVVVPVLAMVEARSGEAPGLFQLAADSFFVWLTLVVPVGLAGAVYLLVLALAATRLPGPDGRPELLLAPAVLVVALFAGLGGRLEEFPELWACVVGGFVFAALAGPVPPPDDACRALPPGARRRGPGHTPEREDGR
ncbi:MAG TPA: hypothetical protein VGV85_02530 [Longimicrobiaceae bacterium]|nr:hypothetical protein [Longimicrobiaceae bacterium]